MLAKTKLNSIEVLIYKTLINQCISDDELVSVNNILREYDYMKKEIQKLKNSTLIIKDFNLFIKQYHYLKQKNTHTHTQKVKTQSLQRKKIEDQHFHQNVRCVIVKYQDLKRRSNKVVKYDQ